MEADDDLEMETMMEDYSKVYKKALEENLIAEEGMRDHRGRDYRASFMIK